LIAAGPRERERIPAVVVFGTRVPTHYNDGTPVPEAVLHDIMDRANTLFGGCTLENPAKGTWRDDQGQVYAEESQRLEIACERGRYGEVREFVIAVGQLLDQKAMYFEVRYFDGAEIIDVPPPAPERKRKAKRRR
jgi:hypothetical protein